MDENATTTKLMTITHGDLMAFADRMGPAIRDIGIELGFSVDQVSMLLAYYTGMCLGLNGFALEVDPDMRPGPLRVVVDGYIRGHKAMRERIGLPPEGVQLN